VAGYVLGVKFASSFCRMKSQSILSAALIVLADLSHGMDSALLDFNSPFLYSDGGFPVVEYFAPIDGKIQPVFQSLKARREYRLVAYYDKNNQASLDQRETLLRTASALNEAAVRNGKSITTYAVSCGEFTSFCEKQEVQSTPSYYFYNQGSSKKVVVDDLDMETICNRMEIPYDIELAKKWWSGTIGTSLSEETEVKPVTRTMEHLSSDIHLSFDSAMRHYVYENDLDKISQPLTVEQRSTLKRWLMLIHKTTPSSWKIHGLVKQLINSFMYVSKNRAYLLSILDTFKPEVASYSPACQGEHHHSFTCGVWEMFHAVSVGLVEYNKIGGDASERIPSRTALSIILKYIETFGMGDDLRAEHYFTQAVRKCLDDEQCLPNIEDVDGSELVKNWIQFPLWMSKTHNEVKENDRKEPVQLVAGAGVSEIKWPPRALCSKCWNRVTGQWNDEVVYKFLKQEYTIVENLTPSLKKELLASKIDPPIAPPNTRTQAKSSNLASGTSRPRYILYFVVALIAARIFVSWHSIRRFTVRKRKNSPLLPDYVSSVKPPYQQSAVRRPTWNGEPSPIKRSTWSGDSKSSPARTPSKTAPRTSHSYAGVVFNSPIKNRTSSSSMLPPVSSAPLPKRSEHTNSADRDPAALRRRSFSSSLSYGY
jgi:hypothetical protein